METTVKNLPNRGLTLLEIVIGMAIVAMAFIPIIRGINYGNKSTVKISNYAKVSKLVKKLVEECKHVPFPTYKEQYSSLKDQSWFAINPEFYPKTVEATKEMEDELKELNIDAQLKVVKTENDVVREIWIQVNATWKEGDGTNKNAPRELRLAQAIHNPDVN